VNSLGERIARLEQDLIANPMRHYHYTDLPFAILPYDPSLEWELRRDAKLLARRVEVATGRVVSFVSLADLMWGAIEDCEGLDAVTALERASGFGAATRQVHDYLTSPLWRPLPDLLVERLQGLHPDRNLVFILRAGALAPDIYRISRLLDELKGRTRVPCVLFMPATVSPSGGMRFMGVAENEGRGSYHTKVYL